MQPDSRFPKLTAYLQSLKLRSNEVFNATVAAADDAGLPRRGTGMARTDESSGGSDPESQRMWAEVRERALG